MSLQENNGKLQKIGNVKAGRALSVVVRPSAGVADKEGDHQMEKKSKLKKSGNCGQQER